MQSPFLPLFIIFLFFLFLSSSLNLILPPLRFTFSILYLLPLYPLALSLSPHCLFVSFSSHSPPPFPFLSPLIFCLSFSPHTLSIHYSCFPHTISYPYFLFISFSPHSHFYSLSTVSFLSCSFTPPLYTPLPFYPPSDFFSILTLSLYPPYPHTFSLSSPILTLHSLLSSPPILTLSLYPPILTFSLSFLILFYSYRLSLSILLIVSFYRCLFPSHFPLL